MPCEKELDLKEPGDQKLLLKSGFRIGRLIVTIPTIVSRTPHRLMFRADGFEPRVRTTRMMAAVMTKRPEQSRAVITNLLHGAGSAIA